LENYETQYSYIMYTSVVGRL